MLVTIGLIAILLWLNVTSFQHMIFERDLMIVCDGNRLLLSVICCVFLFHS